MTLFAKMIVQNTCQTSNFIDKLDLLINAVQYKRKNNRKVRRVINPENRRVNSRIAYVMFEYKNAEVQKIMELILTKRHWFINSVLKLNPLPILNERGTDQPVLCVIIYPFKYNTKPIFINNILVQINNFVQMAFWEEQVKLILLILNGVRLWKL